MNRFLLAMALMLIASAAQAQTATFKLQWDHPDALAVVQQNQYTLKIDSGAAVVVPATCVANGGGTRCTTPLAALPAGSTHTLVLTAFNGFGSTAADPFTGTPPSKASGVTITLTITIP